MLQSGEDSRLLACRDVLEVFRTIERGDASRGVVPIENTLEGSVTATLDALAFETELLIHGELELPVNLVLAAVPGTTLDTLVSVRSHVVALGASRRWLAEHACPTSSSSPPPRPRARPRRSRSSARSTPRSSTRWPPSVTASRSSPRGSPTAPAT
jgi:prephenate dehydratase